MEGLFDVVYQFLKWLSAVSGLTYREINILVYFYLIPSFFIYLLERITKTHYLKMGFLVVAILSLLLIPDFEAFSDKAFDASVVFLKWFEVIGLDYVQASVVICVFLPLLVNWCVALFPKNKKAPLNRAGLYNEIISLIFLT